MKIRTELTGSNMAILFKEKSPHSVPLGNDASWASIIVHDEEPSIIPWSIIFSCYLVGTRWLESKLGNIELPENIVVKNCILRLSVMPEFTDLKYNRWGLFDAKNSG